MSLECRAQLDENGTKNSDAGRYVTGGRDEDAGEEEQRMGFSEGAKRVGEERVWDERNGERESEE